VRRESNIKQAVFAELVNMEQSQYSRRERGILPILDQEWEKISKALGVSKEEIFEPNSKTVYIGNNIYEKDNSISELEIIIRCPCHVFENLSLKLDILIGLLEKK